MTRIMAMSIGRTRIAMRLRRNHLRCIGFASGPGSVRWNRRSETIKVAIATMGVNVQATNPEGRRPSRLEMITAKAIRSRIIAIKTAMGNCRRQFRPDAILKTNIAGRGPEMNGGRKAKARKIRVCMQATYPTYPIAALFIASLGHLPKPDAHNSKRQPHGSYAALNENQS